MVTTFMTSFRHPRIAELRDKSQEDPRERNAADRGLNYAGLTGEIGDSKWRRASNGNHGHNKVSRG